MTYSNTQNQSSQPPAPAGGLFGSSNTTTSQPQQAGTLFGGGAAASQPQQQGGLFGRVQTSQPQQASSIFGNNNTTSQPQQTGGLFGRVGASQPQQSGGLFGSTTTSQPQQSGGLFSNATSNTNQNTGGGLFGGSLNQPAQQQQSSGTGLFGSSTANKPSGLFGASTTNNATTNNTSSLFGGGNSLFGGANTQQNQQQASGGLFGGSTQQQQSAPTNTFLGLTATAPGANAPVSLLGASQYRQPQGSFGGRLTMGQSSTNTTTVGGTPGQQQPQGAVQVNYDTMKSTTRFSDLVPDVQHTLERIDGMIQAQERFARQIEAFIPKHGGDVQSLRPDVELVSEKAEAIETALALDAQGVQGEKGVLQKDGMDGERLQRVIDNLRQPPQFHARGDEGGRDLDLIGNFFMPMTSDMGGTMQVYANAIQEVEAHMAVLEQSAMASAGRGGFGSGFGQPGSGFGNVRELAETLGAFEDGILGAAGMVGHCKEGVDELVLGRVR